MEENKEKLNKKANLFIEHLKQHKILCNLRENLADKNKTKIDLGTAGKIVLYLGKKGFTLTVNEIKDIDLQKRIKELWLDYENGIPPNAEKLKTSDKIPLVYVDGSFLANKVGYGFAVIIDNKILYEENGTIQSPSIVNYRQIGGEIQAVIAGLEWCKLNGISEVNIYYDYKGLECWATGEYMAKNKITKNYRDIVRSSNIKINWIKVEAHTNDRWNDYVDNLAKKGAVNSTSTIENKQEKSDTLSMNDIINFEKFLQEESITYRLLPPKEYLYRFEIKDTQNKKTFVDFWKNDKGNRAKKQFAKNMSLEMKEKLEMFAIKASPTSQDVFKSFEHYFTHLKKYRTYNFDFRILVEEINNVALKKAYEQIPKNSTFNEIESFYLKLKEA